MGALWLPIHAFTAPVRTPLMALDMHVQDNWLAGIAPPDRENVTKVARGVRSQCMSGSVYCPNVCYVIENGKMRLMTFVDMPDAGSDRKMLFVVRDTHPVRRMVEYREDIYRELRAVGVGV